MSANCLFRYSSGRECDGTIIRAKAYGPHLSGPEDRHKVRKYRLWCSKHGDHCGAVSSYVSKDRMEFYPDQLPEGVEIALWEGDLLEL
jgi:hypothetical protein